MRVHLEAWGRERWPDARIMHELVIGARRIDMVFVRPGDLIGVETKSSRDVLDRLEKQAAEFRLHLPEFWVALAPKWTDLHGIYLPNRLTVTEQGIVIPRYGMGPGIRDELVYSRMVDLLYGIEAHRIARRQKLKVPRRMARFKLIRLLAREMRGIDILTEVCTELRNRPTGWQSDPQIGSSDPADPLADMS